MQAILLAAGGSTRFWPLNQDHKSAFTLFGKPLIVHTLMSLQNSNLIDQALVIHAPHSNIPTIIQDANLNVKVRFLEQKIPGGTGDAFSVAIPHITGEFLFVWPDMVNVGMFIQQMVELKQKNNAHAVLLGASTATPQHFGMFGFKDNIISEVVEKPTPEDAPSDIKRVGVEVFDKDFIDTYQDTYQSLQDQGLKEKLEIALAIAIDNYIKLNNKKVMLYHYEENIPVLKYPWDLFPMIEILENTMHNNGACAGEDCIVQENATVGDNVEFKGKCYIGDGARIGDNARIIGPVSIEKNAVIEKNSVIQHSIIGNNAHIHSCELFDSIIGSNVTIQKNFSLARDKHNEYTHANRRVGVVVGDNTTIAKNNTVHSEVLIDSNVTTEPGEVITENITDLTS